MSLRNMSSKGTQCRCLQFNSNLLVTSALGISTENQGQAHAYRRLNSVASHWAQTEVLSVAQLPVPVVIPVSVVTVVLLSVELLVIPCPSSGHTSTGASRFGRSVANSDLGCADAVKQDCYLQTGCIDRHTRTRTHTHKPTPTEGGRAAGVLVRGMLVSGAAQYCECASQCC